MLVFSSPVYLARLYCYFIDTDVITVEKIRNLAPCRTVPLLRTIWRFLSIWEFLCLFFGLVSWLCFVVVVVVAFHYYFHLLFPFKVIVTVDTTVFLVPSGYVTT